jgi:DNA polymerase-1
MRKREGNSKSKSPSTKLRVNKRENKRRLVLIDGHSILFRAFHAYPELTTSKGELVNAVYGFANILLTVIKDLEPTHIAVSFDREEPTFRHEEYEGYKAHRPEAPEELITQQGRVEEIVSVLNIPIFAVEGFEADDVIGTLTRQATTSKKQATRDKDLEVVIVTGDQDMFQLVDSKWVLVYTPARGKQKSKLWDAEAVHEKYGLKPTQLVDFKALSGDPSDEIPGVRGVGPKTATALLKEYGSLDRIYKSLNKIKQKFGEAVFKKLKDGKESAKLSKKLAAIALDVPIKLSLGACVVHDYDKAEAVRKFEELEFSSLIKKLPNDDFEQMVQEEMF